MLKSHIAKIERIRGGFNIEMLEFELDYRWNIIKDDPQFAFRFQMRLSDAISLADTIYNYKRAKFKVEEKKKADQQPLTPIFPNVEISKNQTLPRSPQPYIGVPPAPRQDLRLRQQYHKADPWQGYTYRRLRQILIRSR